MQEHLIEIICAMITAGALGFCRYFYTQLKNYKKLLEEKEDVEILALVDKRLAPFQKELNNLERFVESEVEKINNQTEFIVSSYRFRLIQLCRIYLQKGYMSQAEYDQLSEFYKVYHGLRGPERGHSQEDDYYEKAIQLQIR